MKLRPFALAVAYFFAIIVVAHFFAPPGYTWRHNTISDLASQGHVNKWIMQAGFIGFGVSLTLGAAYYFKRQLRRYLRRYFLIMVAVYGLSIALAGIFCIAPIDPALPYSESEANLHSLFATVAGVGMTLGILWQVIASSNQRDRWLRLAFFVLVSGLSGLFGLADNQMLTLDPGLIQRLLYLSGLAWLMYEERVLTTTRSADRLPIERASQPELRRA